MARAKARRYEWYDGIKETLQLKGLADRSVDTYIREIRKVSEHFNFVDPESLDEEQVREYMLYRRNEDHLSAASLRILYSSFKHYYRDILKRDWQLLDLVRVNRERILPVVLTQAEVHRIINAVSTYHNHVFLWTVYSCGLRLQEGLNLQISDIDRGLMQIHVHRGKGARDRYVPLPVVTLNMLHEFWLTHKNPVWLFPARGRGGNIASTTTRPMNYTSVQGALRYAIRELGIKKHVHPHTFRHSYATHLLEAGVTVRALQQFLGHKHLSATMVYLHLTPVGQADAVAKINHLMGGRK